MMISNHLLGVLILAIPFVVGFGIIFLGSRIKSNTGANRCDHEISGG